MRQRYRLRDLVRQLVHHGDLGLEARGLLAIRRGAIDVIAGDVGARAIRKRRHGDRRTSAGRAGCATTSRNRRSQIDGREGCRWIDRRVQDDDIIGRGVGADHLVRNNSAVDGGDQSIIVTEDVYASAIATDNSPSRGQACWQSIDNCLINCANDGHAPLFRRRRRGVVATDDVKLLPIRSFCERCGSTLCDTDLGTDDVGGGVDCVDYVVAFGWGEAGITEPARIGHIHRARLGAVHKHGVGPRRQIDIGGRSDGNTGAQCGREDADRVGQIICDPNMRALQGRVHRHHGDACHTIAGIPRNIHLHAGTRIRGPVLVYGENSVEILRIRRLHGVGNDGGTVNVATGNADQETKQEGGESPITH